MGQPLLQSSNNSLFISLKRVPYTVIEISRETATNQSTNTNMYRFIQFSFSFDALVWSCVSSSAEELFVTPTENVVPDLVDAHSKKIL
jgi:hypothetical protein